MIIVRFELHSAVTGRITELARIRIINNGDGTGRRGNYTGHAFRGRDTAALDKAIVQKTGTVTNFPRRDLHVWNLFARMLASMGYA